MYSVGLTGGIGSGKSTAAALFAAHGAGVVDTDAIAHALTGPNGRAIPLIRAEFGADTVAADGSLDRAMMRERVFNDHTQRARLEAILHPMIQQEALHAVAALATPHPYVVVVVPLLVESGYWRKNVDRVLLIDCDEEIQIARVIARNGYTRERALSIMNAQASRAARRAAADDIVDNSGSPQHLAPAIAVLHEKYCNSALTKASNAG